MVSVVGTPYYVAPEVLGGKYDSMCDMWSLGVIVFKMIAGKYPFTGKEIDDLFHRISKVQINWVEEDWTNVSDSCRDFIEKLLVADLEARMTANEALEHPWLCEEFVS
jgi:calcium-dependent protein kinase